MSAKTRSSFELMTDERACVVVSCQLPVQKAADTVLNRQLATDNWSERWDSAAAVTEEAR
jgi:hypothetical protein